MNTLTTFSSASTRLFGKEFAKKNLKVSAEGGSFGGKTENLKPRGAFVIALSGELGSGKTTFVQGFVRGLGIKKRMTSPTFIIFRRFKLSALSFKFLYHVDAYRIKKSADLAMLGFKEILKNPKNILLIEWPENIKKIVPKEVLWILFKHGKKENERKIILK
mgnify:CR=1 FL=1